MRKECVKARKNNHIHCRNNEIFFKITVVTRILQGGWRVEGRRV